MKKSIFVAVITALVCFVLCLGAFAEATVSRLSDQAELLTDSEKEQLCDKLDRTSEEHKFDIVVMTVRSLDGKEPEEYAEWAYDYYDFGYGENRDGVLLLLSMENRDYAMTTGGRGTSCINYAVQSRIADNILPMLSSGDYYGAFSAFAEECARYVINYEETGKEYKEPFNIGKTVLICFVISLVIGLIVTAVMKGKLKTVKANDYATHYVVNGSLNVTTQRDLFLYHTVTRVARAEQNSGGSRSGGGGGSHVSSHGKF